MPIASINPATGRTLQVFEPHDERAVEARVAAAVKAQESWRATSFAHRAALLTRAAEILESRRDLYARLMTEEMGKPIGAAATETEKCALGCRFYAERAEAFLADEPVATDASRSFVRYAPLGLVLAVMPWNFPFWQVFRFAAPALMAGNGALLKHASNVPRSALAIEDVFREAGFPEGMFTTLLIGSERVEALVRDPRIAAVTLTGSEGAGVSVGAAAGAAIKKSVLELGGSDPFLVMPSAPLERAVATAVRARTMNNGQSCIAAKRFILHRDIAAEFERRFVEAMRALRIGDPMDPATEIGPLATPAIRGEVHALVEAAVAGGASLALGGTIPEGPGNYYPPTVLTGMTIGNPAAREEIFGPVASIFRVNSLDEAIDIANGTRFGLGASAWTTAPEEIDQCVRDLQAGSVFVNGMVKSDPRLPFGGIKKSGFGRELSHHGIREFVNAKTVWIA